MAFRHPHSKSLFPATTLLVAVACLASASCTMLPGRQIEGTPAEPPRTWEMLGQGTRCELEVDPESPRSVATECYEFEGQLYVDSRRHAWTSPFWEEAWATAVQRDPNVRLAVYGELYDLRAHLVTEKSLRKRVLRSRGFDPVPDGIQLFALQRR